MGDPVEHVEVKVYEPESGLSGHGRIVEVDKEKRLVYLSVDWKTLAPPTGQSAKAAGPLLPL